MHSRKLFHLVVLYVISAVYFAGVMVRLMLTLTPVVCVLSGIAFSLIFDCHMKEEDSASKEIEPENEKKKASSEKVSTNPRVTVSQFVRYSVPSDPNFSPGIIYPAN